ncbi:MAG: GNAT family N-acetyltransferase [Candidatus Thermoplasmatota archaeon]|nr:GNAT family N-acetyltransferase [Candidatus Thermoplasmatota archaeon]
MVGGISGLITHPTNKIAKASGLFRSLLFFSGPVLQEWGEMDRFLSELERKVKKMGFMKFTMRGDDQPIPIKSPGSEYIVNQYCEFIIRLDRDWATIEKGIKRGIRRKLKKAVESKLAFRISKDPAMTDIMEQLMDSTGESRTMRGYDDFKRYYVPFTDREVLKGQLRNGISGLGFAENDNGIPAMLYFIHFGKRAFAVYIGSTKEGYENGANAFVYQGIMEHLHRNGCERFNLGRTPLKGREGLMQFKEGLGADRTSNYTLVSPILKGPVLMQLLRLNQFVESWKMPISTKAK